MSLIAAVRVRGVPDANKKASKTMQTLRLHNKNNCMLFEDTDANRGMLRQAKDYIAYGDVGTETVESLLAKRGSVHGNTVSDEIESLGYDSVADLAEALEDGDSSLSTLRNKGLSIPFRLSPPSKGFKDSRRHYNQGGSLGERDDMENLLRRMV